MDSGLIKNIAEKFKENAVKVFLVENNDRFLFRKDVREAFSLLGIEIASGSNLNQRIMFEMREPDGLLILLNQGHNAYLEDIEKESLSIEFNLKNFFHSYHIPSIIDLELSILDKLYINQPYISLDRRGTLKHIKQTISDSEAAIIPEYNIEEFKTELNRLLNEDDINWAVVSRLLANSISRNIGETNFAEVYAQVNEANVLFQKKLRTNYNQTKNSSAVKKPRIVSKIMDYLDFNFRNKKIALIVVDGMAMWQYELLRSKLPKSKHEEVIYSWLPSITQLSRQAIFRGDKPWVQYKQGPVNEEKLWKRYWSEKGCLSFEIDYQHEKINLSSISSITKLAIVYKDLDDKMHGSTDYKDLKLLTANWIDRSKIGETVKELVKRDFNVFITSDHGNIQARGWRGLKGKEKLGTNKSGSRSQRHIEYEEKWLSNEFIENNPEVEDYLLSEEQTIFFANDLSFSNEESLVTHGGSHILEVLIPFVRISN